jgi:hypothetical protein
VNRARQETPRAPSHPVSILQGETPVANINDSLNKLLEADGAVCAAIVDANSGMLLGKAGSGVDLELAAAGNTEVVRAKLKTMKSLGLNDTIEDILITLGKQYHIIRPVLSKPGLFVYLVLDKAKSNLALARRNVQDVETTLSL